MAPAAFVKYMYAWVQSQSGANPNVTLTAVSVPWTIQLSKHLQAHGIEWPIGGSSAKLTEEHTKPRGSGFHPWKILMIECGQISRSDTYGSDTSNGQMWRSDTYGYLHHPMN